MGYSKRNILLSSSSVIAVVLIATGYALSGPLPFHINKAGAESTHDLLVSYASKDSDGDGLPDWEEALYGTDPNNAHSVSPTLTDSEAVAQGLVKPKFANATSTPADSSVVPGVAPGPETLTDQFGKSLFGDYLKSRGATPPTSADIAAFVQQGVTQLKQSQAHPDTFNQGQVRVAGSGPDALLVYAADMEQVFNKTKFDGPKSEIDYYADAANGKDPAAIAKVARFGKGYAEMAQGLMKITVPKELASSHLAFANNMMRLSSSILDMGALDTDPIRSMLGLATYQDNSVSFVQSLKDINTVFKAENAIPPVGTRGSQFYALTANVTPKK